MIVGVDFDNTLVNYGDLFHREAVNRGLVPPDVAGDRQSVRDFLRSRDRDADFTLLQAHIYGPGILKAEPYPHALETVAALLRSGWQIFIISHKTRFPYSGPAHDLHEFARNWLNTKGFIGLGMLDSDDVFMETSLEDKLKRVAAQNCDYFVDDLPEFLTHPDFPGKVERMLFDPYSRNCSSHPNIRHSRSWPEIWEYLSSHDSFHE